jgi:F-type H+-transporting ATPase subunit b
MAGLLLAQGGILEDLGINPWVVGMQGIIFFLTFLALRKVLFQRIMDHMTAREAEAQGAEEKIRHDRAEAERLARELESHLARIDKEAWERMQAVLKEAMEARGRIAADAQQKAAQETRQALEAISRDRAAALESLRKEVPAMAREVVQRVIGVPESDALQAAGKGGAR